MGVTFQMQYADELRSKLAEYEGTTTHDDHGSGKERRTRVEDRMVRFWQSRLDNIERRLPAPA